MTESLDELIQRVLDGDATATDKLHLEQRLASNSAARARYDELARVFEALSAVQLDEAPAGLRDDVLRSVREAALARTPAAARTGAAPAPRVLRPAFPWFRFALPVAAGAVAIAILFASFGGPLWRGGDRVTGTMAAADPAVLRLGSGSGTVVVRSNPAPGGFLLRITTGNVPATVRLESVGGTLLARNGDAPPAASLETAIPANAETLVEGTAGPADPVVRVRVELSGGRVVSGELRVPAAASPR